MKSILLASDMDDLLKELEDLEEEEEYTEAGFVTRDKSNEGSILLLDTGNKIFIPDAKYRIPYFNFFAGNLGKEPLDRNILNKIKSSGKKCNSLKLYLPLNAIIKLQVKKL